MEYIFKNIHELFWIKKAEKDFLQFFRYFDTSTYVYLCSSYKAYTVVLKGKGDEIIKFLYSNKEKGLSSLTSPDNDAIQG